MLCYTLFPRYSYSTACILFSVHITYRGEYKVNGGNCGHLIGNDVQYYSVIFFKRVSEVTHVSGVTPIYLLRRIIAAVGVTNLGVLRDSDHRYYRHVTRL